MRAPVSDWRAPEERGKKLESLVEGTQKKVDELRRLLTVNPTTNNSTSSQTKVSDVTPEYLFLQCTRVNICIRNTFRLI